MIGRWVLPAFAFAVSVAYWPLWHDGAVSPKWCVLAALPLALLWVRPRMTSAHWAILALLAYSAMSALWSVAPLDTINYTVRAALLAAAFLIAAETDDLRATYRASAIGVSLSGFLALAELLGWVFLPAANHPAALFGNKNYMAEAGAVCLVAAVAYRMWWAIPGLSLALVIPASRGALIAVAATGGIWLWGRSRILAVCAFVASVVIVVVTVQILNLSTFSSVTARLDIWLTAVSHLAFFGHGFGSFQAMYPLVHDYGGLIPYGRPEHAHNEFINLAFELGAPGAVAASFVIFGVWLWGTSAEHAILAVVLVMCMFSFPLHLPVVGFMAAVMAGHVCGRGRRLRRVPRFGRGKLFSGYGVFRPSYGSLGV